MRAWLAILVFAFTGAAQAAQHVYAVISLVGDGLLLVRNRATTGTSLAGSVHEFLPVKDPVFDRTALLAVDDAVRKSEPGAKTVLLGGRDAALLEAQSGAIGSDQAVRAIAARLRPTLQSTGATDLVLVVKSRHPAEIEFSGSRVGSGTLEGLGYYIDDSVLPPDRTTTGDKDTGFLAPFACFTVAVVDLATGSVLARKQVYLAHSISEKLSATLSPWDALTPEQKIGFVRELLRAGLEGSVPALLPR